MLLESSRLKSEENTELVILPLLGFLFVGAESPAANFPECSRKGIRSIFATLLLSVVDATKVE